MLIGILHPTSLEKGIFEVCVFSLDDKNFGALNSHGFFPGVHISAFLLFLLIVRRRWFWLFFLFDFFAFKIDGLELRRVGKIELFSVLVFSLKICDFNQFIPGLYRINDILCFLICFFGNFFAIIHFHITDFGQWVHEGFSFKTRLNNNQRIVTKVLGYFFPFQYRQK